MRSIRRHQSLALAERLETPRARPRVREEGFALGIPFRQGSHAGCLGPQLVVLQQFVRDFLDNGPQVRLAGARGDHEVVGDRRQLAHVQDNDVFRLFILSQLPAEQGQSS